MTAITPKKGKPTPKRPIIVRRDTEGKCHPHIIKPKVHNRLVKPEARENFLENRTNADHRRWGKFKRLRKRQRNSRKANR